MTINSISTFFGGIGPWIVAHPVFAAVIFWPIITAIVTWFLKPRTPEEYAALAADHPRVAQVLRLIGALGLDLPKVLQILGDLVKRIPKGPAVVFLVLTVGLGTSGCALFTKSNAKSALDAITIACALERATLDDASIAKACDIADVLMPDIKRILATHRAQLYKAQRAGACRDADAGVDGGK